MLKASEVMTRSLATCMPDALVSEVAAIMRDRDIGDVLVVEDGRLRGIVTDRDLTVQALAGQDDPQQTPIRKYMSAKVVTGEPDWSLERVAKTMAKHQIRRLPIVENDILVGVVSLGDVALHANKKNAVAESLQAISTAGGNSRWERLGRGHVVAAMALAASATTLVALLTLNRSTRSQLKKIGKSRLYKTAYQTAAQAMNVARDKAGEVVQDERVRELSDQMRAKLDEVVAKAPTIQIKPKRKRFWFA